MEASRERQAAAQAAAKSERQTTAETDMANMIDELKHQEQVAAYREKQREKEAARRAEARIKSDKRANALRGEITAMKGGERANLSAEAAKTKAYKKMDVGETPLPSQPVIEKKLPLWKRLFGRS